MLSYQHHYHAGGQADVHKHMALCALLTEMVQDPTPITYVETHAGRGLYDLTTPEAQKTGEAERGVLDMLKRRAIPNTHPYFKMVHDRKHYPGSPVIAQRILRQTDQIHLLELHPQEFKHLQSCVRGNNVFLYHEDGYDTLLEMIPPAPPTPVRGLVLIDPSYEIKSEYSFIPQFVEEVQTLWPQATVMVWYPILEAGLHVDMVKALQALHPAAIPAEAMFTNERALGSGILLLNAPAYP